MSHSNNDDDDDKNNGKNTFGVPLKAMCSPSDKTTDSASLTFGGGDNVDEQSDDKEDNDLDRTNKIILGHESRVHEERNFLVLGRQATTCDIRISHKSLSRQHAVLYYCYFDNNVHGNSGTSSTTNNHDVNTSAMNDSEVNQERRQEQEQEQLGLYVIDLNTKSGTFINQQKIESNKAKVLHHGDVIQFGKAQPIFTVKWNLDKINSQRHDKEKGMGTSVPTNDDNNGNGNKNDEPTLQLSGREQRQAEIAAMMASFDEVPTYTKYNPTISQHQQQKKAQRQQQQQKGTSSSTKDYSAVLEKHRLPVTDSTPVISFLESSSSDTTGNTATTAAGGGGGTVLASAVMDPSGARFVMAGMDSSLRLYDFAGLQYDIIRPFENVYVQEGYPIRNIGYSPTGDRFVVSTGSIQPKLFDRDGNETLQFVRGDVYVTDPTKTSGHTASITGVAWHMLERSIVFTSSRDGSWRVWNVDKGKLAFGMLKCHDVIVVKNLKTGRKTIPTCLIMSSPTTIAIGTECGSVQVYNYPLVSKLRPQQSTIIDTSHPPPPPSHEETNKSTKATTRTTTTTTKTEPVLQLVSSMDTTKLAVRTMSTLSVYHNLGNKSFSTTASTKLSMSTEPLLKLYNVGKIDNVDHTTPTMAFSPNGKIIAVGIIVPSSTSTSSTPTTTTTVNTPPSWRIEFYNLAKIEAKKSAAKTQMGASDFNDNNNNGDDDDDKTSKKKKKKSSTTKPIYVLYPTDGSNNDDNAAAAAASSSSLVGICWHVKLNQLLITTTHSFRIWYSVRYSKNGILLSRGGRLEEDVEDENEDDDDPFTRMKKKKKRKQRQKNGEESLQELYASRAPPPGAGIRQEDIITPYALPLFQNDNDPSVAAAGGEGGSAAAAAKAAAAAIAGINTKRRKKKHQIEEEAAQAEQRAHIPQRPPGRGIYNTPNTIFAQMVMDSQTRQQTTIAGKDPREALAKYNEGKSYIGTAYAGNQERILAEKTMEEEEEELRQQKR